MPKKRIAFLTISLMKGGAEKIIALLVNELYDDYDIHLVLLSNTIEFELPLDKISIHFIGKEHLTTKKKLIKILALPFAAYRLKKILVENDIPLVVSFLNRPNFISGLLKVFGWKGKSIISERNYTLNEYPSNGLQDRLGRVLVKKLYPLADLIMPNSIAIAESLKNDFSVINKIIPVYNPINIAETEILSQLPTTRTDFPVFTFIAVSRLSTQKNQRMILEAVKLLPSLPFQVLIIGKGELEESLKKIAHKEGVEGKVKFMGFVSNPLPYIAKADCFIMSSDFEGFPNALLEALACGKPVISTDCLSGPREILNDAYNGYHNIKEVEKAKFGILVPVKNAALLAAAMKEIMEDKELASNYAAKAKGRAADFDSSIIVKQFKTLLSEILK